MIYSVNVFELTNTAIETKKYIEDLEDGYVVETITIFRDGRPLISTENGYFEWDDKYFPEMNEFFAAHGCKINPEPEGYRP